MSYTPSTDFFALMRTVSGGVRLASAPALDVILSALARAGFITLFVDPTAGPVSNQATTIWLKTASPSYNGEGAVYLWNAGASAYQPATPALFAAYLVAIGA